MLEFTHITANIRARAIYPTSGTGTRLPISIQDRPHGARVTIDYVQRPEVKIDPYRHGVFWKDWIDDNRGTIEIIHRLQGG